jgi:membrane-bound lytic murein transglycosylase B
MSAALVVFAVPVSMAGLSPAIVPTSKTVVPRAVASAQVSIAPIAPSVTTLQRHYVRTLPPAQRPQVVAEQTTIVGGLSLRTKKDRNRKIAVSSSKGSHVWTASSLAEHDLPSAAMRAYKNAASNIDAADPGCHLGWTLLAGIGRVESDHGRYGGSVLGNDGVPRPAIVGVPLNGKGPVAAIHDTDGGSFDGDKVWDRAVGPMQFIPSTWSGGAGRDGDGDGKKSPNDLDDASLAAAAYLCNGGGDLADDTAVKSAVFRYNPSDYYVALVTAFARGYRTGVFVIPSPDLPPSADDAAKKTAKAKARAARIKAAKAKARAARAEARARARAAAASKAAAARLARARAAKAAAARAAAAAAARHKPTSTPTKAPTTTTGGGGGGGGGTSTPTPTPTPEPPSLVLDAVTGLLEGSGADWTLGGHALDFGTGRMGDTAARDYDGANGIQTVGAELAGLAGQNVTLQVKAGTWDVYLIAGKDYRNADGSFSTAG